jgi:hypothetical protein
VPRRQRNRAVICARDTAGVKRLLTGARSASPYLLVELLLPGGTLIALLLWIWRLRQRA